MEKDNLFPSTAHYEGGEYVADPLNQPFAYQNREAHDVGQLRHPTAVQGYCEAHLKLGCEVCSH